jgi:uncharacterized Tic20 family protein
MVEGVGVLEEMLGLLPVLIPLAILQLGLMIFALIHAIKHPRYRMGNMIVWVLVIILINIIGPILYFVIGRGEAEEADE